MSEIFVSDDEIFVSDDAERQDGCEQVIERLKELLKNSSSSVAAANDFRKSIPLLFRHVYECPFNDVRSAFTIFLQTIEKQLQCKPPFSAPSFFIPLDALPVFDSQISKSARANKSNAAAAHGAALTANHSPFTQEAQFDTNGGELDDTAITGHFDEETDRTARKAPANTSNSSHLLVQQQILFEDIFLRFGRVSHVDRTIGHHPSFLSSYIDLSNFILYDNGPLPQPMRHYIACLAAVRYRCWYLVSQEEKEFLAVGGESSWIQSIQNAPKKLQALYELNALLAHQPWLLTKDHIAKLVHNKGADSWSISELVHAIVILTTFHSLAAFVCAFGIAPEYDMGHWNMQAKIVAGSPAHSNSNSSSNATLSSVADSKPSDVKSPTPLAPRPVREKSMKAETTQLLKMLTSNSNGLDEKAADANAAQAFNVADTEESKTHSPLSSSPSPATPAPPAITQHSIPNVSVAVLYHHFFSAATQYAAQPLVNSSSSPAAHLSASLSSTFSASNGVYTANTHSAASVSTAASVSASAAPNSSTASSSSAASHAASASSSSALIAPSSSPPASSSFQELYSFIKSLSLNAHSTVADFYHKYHLNDESVHTLKQAFPSICTSIPVPPNTHSSTSPNMTNSSSATSASHSALAASYASSTLSRYHFLRYQPWDANSNYTFYDHDFSWKENGVALLNRFYSGAGSSLDQEFDLIYGLTYHTFSGRSYDNLDTGPFRRAVWHYTHRLYGIFHSDYNYGILSKCIPMPMKTVLKKLACTPETCCAADFQDLGADLSWDEKIHIGLLVMEARRQAALLYALHATMKYMNQ